MDQDGDGAERRELVELSRLRHRGLVDVLNVELLERNHDSLHIGRLGLAGLHRETYQTSAEQLDSADVLGGDDLGGRKHSE